MIALILGGAPSIWLELEAAKAMLSRPCVVVAANLAGIECPDRIDGWATLHPDRLNWWAAERAGNKDFRPFAPEQVLGRPDFTPTPERWPGSSGLYAAQVALFELGAAGVILCGVPMESRAGHFTGRTPWESVIDYRRAFQAALPEIGGRVRSMGGWTQNLFGAPTREWIDAIHPARPLGVSRSSTARKATMHSIKNVSETTQRFNAHNVKGELYIARLAPGQAADFDADVDQAVFVRGYLKATPLAEAEDMPATAAASATTTAPAGHKPLKPRATDA